MSSALIACGVVLLVVALLLRQRTGLPWKRVRYSDTSRWQRAEQPLVARQYHLTGKPDYLVQSGRSVIPVEVKPRREADRPYHSDVMQLAAYCLLVEETVGTAPPYGLLRYAHATWQVRWDQRLRRELLALLREMQETEMEIASSRSHDEPARCRACGFVSECEQALV